MKGTTQEDVTENLESTERLGTDRKAKGLFVPVSKYRTFNPGSFVSIRTWADSQSHDNLLKLRTGQTEAPETSHENNMKRAFMSLPLKVARKSCGISFNFHQDAEKANVSDPEVPGYFVKPPVFSPIRTLTSIASSKKPAVYSNKKLSPVREEKQVDSFQVEGQETERKSNAFLVPSEKNTQLLQAHSKSNLNPPSSTFTPEFRIDSELGSFQHSRNRAGNLEPATNLDNSKSSNRIDTNIDLAEILLKEDNFQSYLHSKEVKVKKTDELAVRSLQEAVLSQPKLKRKPTGPPNAINSSSESE